MCIINLSYQKIFLILYEELKLFTVNNFKDVNLTSFYQYGSSDMLYTVKKTLFEYLSTSSFLSLTNIIFGFINIVLKLLTRNKLFN